MDSEYCGVGLLNREKRGAVVEHAYMSIDSGWWAYISNQIIFNGLSTTRILHLINLGGSRCLQELM